MLKVPQLQKDVFANHPESRNSKNSQIRTFQDKSAGLQEKKLQKTIESSKETLKTQNFQTCRNSDSTGPEAFSAFSSIDKLDFTFHHDRQEQKKKNKSFSNSQPYSVFLFGLLFNHIYLQNKRCDLVEANKLSSSIVTHVVSAVSSLQSKMPKIRTKFHLSSNKIARLLARPKSLEDLNNKEEQLRVLFEAVPSKMMEFIFKELKQKPSKVEEYRLLRKVNDENGNYCKVSESRLSGIIKQIDIIAQNIGVCCKFIQGPQTFNLGQTSSLIAISLKHNAKNGNFCLKSLHCSKRHH